MAFVFGSVISSIVPQIFASVIGKAIDKAATSPQAQMGQPAKPTVAHVIEAMKQEPDIAVVKVKPGIKSISGWALALGAVMQLTNYVAVNAGDSGTVSAAETIASAVGLPTGAGSAIVGAVTLACMGVALFRKIFMTDTITPAAANRAVAAGKAL